MLFKTPSLILSSALQIRKDAAKSHLNSSWLSIEIVPISCPQGSNGSLNIGRSNIYYAIAEGFFD